MPHYECRRCHKSQGRWDSSMEEPPPPDLCDECVDALEAEIVKCEERIARLKRQLAGHGVNFYA